jgi:hypothetical protein
MEHAVSTSCLRHARAKGECAVASASAPCGTTRLGAHQPDRRLHLDRGHTARTGSAQAAAPKALAVGRVSSCIVHANRTLKALSCRDPDLVFAFADTVASGLARDESDPARRLHVRLRDAAMRRERLRPIDFAVVTAKSWNAWLGGDGSQTLRILDTDRTNAGFPKIATGARASLQTAAE